MGFDSSSSGKRAKRTSQIYLSGNPRIIRLMTMPAPDKSKYHGRGASSEISVSASACYRFISVLLTNDLRCIERFLVLDETARALIEGRNEEFVLKDAAR